MIQCEGRHVSSNPENPGRSRHHRPAGPSYADAAKRVRRGGFGFGGIAADAAYGAYSGLSYAERPRIYVQRTLTALTAIGWRDRLSAQSHRRFLQSPACQLPEPCSGQFGQRQLEGIECLVVSKWEVPGRTCAPFSKP